MKLNKLANTIWKTVGLFSIIVNVTQADLLANLNNIDPMIVNNTQTRQSIIDYMKNKWKLWWRLKKFLNKKHNTIVADKYGYLFEKENEYIDQSLIPYLDKFDNLETFIQNYPEIWDYYIDNVPKNNDDIIFIFRNKDINNKFILLYYKDWKLKIATYVSPWKKWHYTAKRLYYIWYKEIVHYSKKYQNTPMPFSQHLAGWYFLHMWWKVDGKPRSHGCIRLGWIAAKQLWEDTNKKVPVVFYWYKWVSSNEIISPEPINLTESDLY